MKKRTLVTLLFYFFFSTNARNVRDSNQQKNSSQSVGDFIADMVRTFALSGENGQLAFGKGEKSKGMSQGNQHNVVSAMLEKLLFNGDDEDMGQACTQMLSTLQFLTPTFATIEPSCMESFNHLICKPLNGTYTATDALKELLVNSPFGKVIDSWSKIPERILLGNLQWVGAYDECTMVNEAKYCSSNFKLDKFGLDQTLIYGSCWPKKCNTQNVSSIFTKGIPEVLDIASSMGKVNPKIAEYASLFFSTHERTLCDDERDWYTPGWKATVVLISLIACLITIGTAIESVQEFMRPDPEEDATEENRSNEKPAEFKMECGMNNTAFTTQFSTAELTKSQSESNLETTRTIVCEDADSTFRSPTTCANSRTSCNYLLDFFLCFSLLRNSRLIFSTDVPERTVKCINGIRVISFTWIVLGNYHLSGVMKMKTNNILSVVSDAIYNFSFMVVSNAYVSVDTFFLLSGFLVAYLTLKKFSQKALTKSEVLWSYLHRYIRITPSLAVVLLMYNFFPQILRGPRAAEFTNPDEIGGTHYWWSVICYFNNFYPTMEEGGSLFWTFYLALDMQFFIISPIILFVMIQIHRSQASKTMAVLYNFMFLFSMCLASFLITAIVTLKFGLPSIATAAMYPIHENSTYTLDHAEELANKVYSKPWCRITPYLVGMFLGYLLVHDIKPKMKGMQALITATGWTSAVVGGITVVYGPWRVFARDGAYFTKMETTLYSACHRFVWGCAVAWVIYACHYRRGGIINKILSWPIWMPLSRMTYSAFLMHMEIIYVYTLVKETPIHYQINETVFAFIPIVVLTYASAFVLTVCVEYPVMNLEKFVRRIRQIRS